jgi:hypothetical protein
MTAKKDVARGARPISGWRLGLLAMLLVTTGAMTVRAQGPGLPPQAAEFEGELEVHVDDSDQGAHITHYLNTPAGQLRLQFPGEAPSLLTGTRIRVRGVVQDNTLALASSEGTIINVVALASQNTFGPQSTLVILVNFQDNQTQPYTVTSAYDVTFNTGNRFFQEVSYKQTSLTGNVVGWFTIAMSSTSCDTSKIGSLAEQAAVAAGVNVGAYPRRVYAFPKISACGWSGSSTVGGNPSRSFINGPYEFQVVGHELGHAYGAYHSHSRECDSTACTAVEYGDYEDIMGHLSTQAHLNAFQKERLGWLNYGISPPVQVVNASGDYWIDAYEPTTNLPKALKILKSVDPTTGARTWYYIETRTKWGFDALMGIRLGVIIHTGTESTGNSSYQLDMDPVTTTWDPVLDPGQSFSDPQLGLTITTRSVYDVDALVNISFGNAPTPTCTRSAPVVSMSPAQSQALAPATAFSYAVSISNTDSSACTPASLNFLAAIPSGWNAAFGSTSLAINPGASASTTLNVTSSSTATDGSYPISASATNATSGLSGSSAATYVVSVPTTSASTPALSVAVSTAQATYPKSAKSADLLAKVTVGTAPVVGATVTFTITDPTGKATRGNTKTDATGIASFTMRWNANTSVGTYQVTAIGSAKGASGSGSTTFAIQ